MTNKHYESLKEAATKGPDGKTIIKVQYPRIIVVVWLLNEALKADHTAKDIATWDKVCGNSLAETMEYLDVHYDRVIWVCGGRCEFFGCDEQMALWYDKAIHEVRSYGHMTIDFTVLFEGWEQHSDNMHFSQCPHNEGTTWGLLASITAYSAMTTMTKEFYQEIRTPYWN